MKRSIAHAAATLLLAGGSTAVQAQTSYGTFTSSLFNLTFEIATNPTVTFDYGDGFYTTGTGTLNGVATAFPSFTFVGSGYVPGGGFSYNGSFNDLFSGAQVYSGPSSSPTLVNGTYTLTSYRDGSVGTLVISSSGAVPEPATWALLILGFGAVGGAMRRRSNDAKASRMMPTFA